jgi:hypothetical protein
MGQGHNFSITHRGNGDDRHVKGFKKRHVLNEIISAGAKANNTD